MDKAICAVGIDMTEEYAQISYMLEGDREPVSLSVSPEEKKYLIPAAMYYKEENGTWYVGDEAVFNSSADRKECLDFDRDIRDNRDNLAKYIELLLELTKRIAEADIDGVICVTVEDNDLSEIRCIYEALRQIGYDDDRVRVINHDEAFIYYMVNQKKELWVNDVVLFDFTKKHFKYRKLHEIKGKRPPVLIVDSEELSEDINERMIRTDVGRQRADKFFLELINTEFKRHIVCSAFLTGTGFYEDWAEESLREMCSRRRVFKGYNLFVKGAGFAAHRRYCKDVSRNHIFQCKGRTKCDIGLMIKNQGKDMTVSLSAAGSNWYEAGAQAECILDDTDKITLVAISAEDGRLAELNIDLSDFPQRPPKTTRVKITLGYQDDAAFDVEVRDMGFGEFFKSSEKVIKETFSTDTIFG